MLRRGLGFLVPCCSPCRTMLRGGEGRSTDVSHGGAAHRRRMAGRWQGTSENLPSPPSANCPRRRGGFKRSSQRLAFRGRTVAVAWLQRGDESEGLAGSAVEFGSDGLEVLSVVDREVGALG